MAAAAARGAATGGGSPPWCGVGSGQRPPGPLKGRGLFFFKGDSRVFSSEDCSPPSLPPLTAPLSSVRIRFCLKNFSPQFCGGLCHPPGVLFLFVFVFIFSRGCPPLVCVVCGNGELGKYKHRGKDVVWWPAGASFRRQQRPDRAGAGTAATPGLDSPQPPARPPPPPPPPLPASGGAGRCAGRRARGGAEARGRGGGEGGGACWAWGRRGAVGPGRARGPGPRPRPPGGRAGGAPPLLPEAGPAAPAGEGLPEQPQNKNRVWGAGRIPKTHRDPL